MPEIDRLAKALRRAYKTTPPDDAATADILEQITAHPKAGEAFELVELLSDLADCYRNIKRYDDAIRAMKCALAEGYAGEPDGRARIAEYHLMAGRPQEAHDLYALVKADTPEDIWLYNNAGFEYAFAGDHVQAVQWLSEGLELAMGIGDPEDLVDQMAERRGLSLAALGRQPDELQDRAANFLRDTFPLPSLQSPETLQALSKRPLAVGWFPQSEFAAAMQRWPTLTNRQGISTFDEYRQHVGRDLAKIAGTGIKPTLAPLAVAALIAWCEQRDLDPGSQVVRGQYATFLAAQGQAKAWPPGRNDPCWCGSGKKYKKCCGAVSA